MSSVHSADGNGEMVEKNVSGSSKRAVVFDTLTTDQEIFLSESTRTTGKRHEGIGTEKAMTLANSRVKHQVEVRKQIRHATEIREVATKLSVMRFAQWSKYFLLGWQYWEKCMQKFDKHTLELLTSRFPTADLCVGRGCIMPVKMEKLMELKRPHHTFPFFPFLVRFGDQSWIIPWSYFFGMKKRTVFHKIFSNKIPRAEEKKLVTENYTRWRNMMQPDSCYPKVDLFLEDFGDIANSIKKYLIAKRQKEIQTHDVSWDIGRELKLRRRRETLKLSKAFDFLLKQYSNRRVFGKKEYKRTKTPEMLSYVSLVASTLNL